MKRLTRLLREPLLHFAALGGLIFLFFAVINETQVKPGDLIVVTPERIHQLTAGYRSVWNRLPTDDELDALIEEHIREEVYYREALALALDRNDAVVRRRLRQMMEFLTDTGSYLQEPSAGELETYFAANEKAYRRAQYLAFEQVYFGKSPDPESIARSLSALQSNPATDPAALGERSFLPAELGLSPPVATDSVFGQGFFERLAELPPGVWAGPVRSAYGVHLVHVLEILPARTPPLEEVRETVLGDWRAAEALENREQDYARRRARFVVEIRRDEAQPTAER
jgi:hypothetical protein